MTIAAMMMSRLPSSSPTSPGLVVTTLRNMSTAMTERPYMYSSTIWDAAKNMMIIIQSDVRPIFALHDMRSM